MATRWAALAALAMPVTAGLAYMAAFGAPGHYLAINLAGLAAGGILTMLGRPPPDGRPATGLVAILLALLFVPLATGPEISGIARWLPLGPVTLHAGMLAIPGLSVLAARMPEASAPLLLAALFACFLQPDAAGGFAITFAAVGLHHVTRDWRAGIVAIIGFFASIVMAVRGELPPVEFVERVVADAATASLPAALGLAMASIAGFVLILKAAPLEPAARFALAGSLFGFLMMSVLNHYPAPLIGYGAAPILGYGLALGLVRKGAA